MDQIVYREMRDDEEGTVCDLVRQVFDEFVAPDYGPEGIKEFFRYANPGALRERVEAGGFVLVADKSNQLVGMLEFAPPDRVALLFVILRHQGIANELLERAICRLQTAQLPISKLTVHSSPYAELIYEKMGFHRSGGATTDHGITYVPMERDLASTALSM
ncbi:MAG: GNAT family N-acetyltransferase [Woeseiaceae bacterium]|nr:GNAT family N-acetyltransferase [Woeseiaceae bacterium]